MSNWDKPPTASEQEKIDEDLMINSASRKAKELTEKHRIKPESFSDLYSPETIKRDEAETQKAKKDFEQKDSEEEKRAKILADIFEAIIFDQGEMSEWFGGSVKTVKTSEYDDIVNGVDAILEFNEKRRKSHLALGIDATYQTFADQKIDRIKNRIKRGEMAKVKYFHSENFHIRGEYSQIPLTIISARAETIKELIKLWVNKDHKALANHWIQFQMIEETIMQCEYFANYARKHNQEQIAETYDNLTNLSKRLLEERKKEVTDTGQRDANLGHLKLSIKDS